MYAGTYLEPSRTTMREILCKNQKKTFCRCSTGFWHRFYSRKGFQNVNNCLTWSKSTSKICHYLLTSRINEKKLV